jgi:hypothetical protein
MPESVKVPAAKADAKLERAVPEGRKPEVRPHPGDLHAQLLFQQRTIGNQAVQRLIKSGSLHTPRQLKSLARHPALDQDEGTSLRPLHGQTVNPDLLNSNPRSTSPANRISRITALPGSSTNPNSQKLPIHTKHNRGAFEIQRHWYNFDIPFTNYQFDPSLEGVKTAAGVVKDAAVSGLEWIVDEIKSLVSSGIDWLGEKWDALQDFASSALDSATKALTGIIGFLASPLSFIADAIMSFDAQSIAKAWSQFSGVVSTVANGFKGMTDGLLQQINNLWGGINGFATSILNRVSGLTGNFLFKKLPDALQNIAFAVINRLKSLWQSINDGWNKLFNKVKSWVDGAIDKVFSFVKRVLSFGINVVIAGIVQFGQLVRFLKDFFENPQKYIEILAQKSVAAFSGVEAKLAGVVAKYFASPAKAQHTASATTVHRQLDTTAVPEAKTSASWGDIGNGVLEMMGKKWNEFKSNPLAIVKGLLIDLVFPILGNIKDVIQLFQDIKKIVTGPLSAGSLEELWTSILQILDIPILISKTVVSILMRSLMVPLIVATFVPHPLVKAIAAAVGESLLAAFVSTELTDIEHKVLLLKTGATTKNQKADAYNRVADSLIALAMTAVIILVMLILHFIANVMKGIYNFIKGKVFPVERPAVSVESRTEPKGPHQEPDPKAPEAKGKPVPSEDGKRSIRINEEGKCEVCASPCDDIRKKYSSVISADHEAKIKAIEDNASLTDPQKEVELKPIEQDLANLFRQRMLGNPKIVDAAQLDRLLRNPKLSDPAQFDRLLNNPKLTDASQLERLLASPRVADAGQLENMLNRLGNAGDLERFLAAGNPIWDGNSGRAPAEASTAADYAAANGGAAQPGFEGGRPYGNNGLTPNDMILPRNDGAGNPITYREYDVKPRRAGVNRGAERVVIGSDGNRYYTDTHYRSFTRF